MKKHFWKLEYSIALMIIFSIIILLLPTSIFPSKEALFVSRWNEIYDDVDYMFSAMNAQANSDIVRSLKKSKSDAEREKYMMLLAKPYLRLRESDNLVKRYKPCYMDGSKVKNSDYFYFDKIYLAEDDMIVGVKDICDDAPNHPGFIMMFDVNGLKRPNVWGKDIYGVNIYSDGQIKPIGFEMELSDIKKDCSISGTGTSCSQYYRIGGEIND